MNQIKGRLQVPLGSGRARASCNVQEWRIVPGLTSLPGQTEQRQRGSIDRAISLISGQIEGENAIKVRYDPILPSSVAGTPAALSQTISPACSAEQGLRWQRRHGPS
jgi:hypothetical protein